MTSIAQHYCPNRGPQDVRPGFRICHACMDQYQQNVPEGIPLGCVSCNSFAYFERFVILEEGTPFKYHSQCVFKGQYKLAEDDHYEIRRGNEAPSEVHAILNNVLSPDLEHWWWSYHCLHSDPPDGKSHLIRTYDDYELNQYKKLRFQFTQLCRSENIVRSQAQNIAKLAWDMLSMREAQESLHPCTEQHVYNYPALNFVFQAHRLDRHQNDLVVEAWEQARDMQSTLWDA